MMTPLKWFLLCGLLILYLLIGGAVFMAIEQAHEMQQNEDFVVLKRDVREILLLLDRKYYDNETSPAVINAIEAAKEGVIHRISESCGGHNLLDESDVPTDLRWSYYNSVFFAFTAVTTIGYGNLSPTTYWSRALTMIYALFGIPINGILITGLSKYFASKLINVHKRSKDKLHGNRLSFIFDIAFYLIPGLLVFVVVPAGFFVVIEGWPYLDAIYFSFITLTTIGFGDYVAGMGDGHSVWLWIYKIVMIIWIIFGLGYFVMILSFITKGMTHKKVKNVINKKLSKIKITKDKLIKDIDYLRRVVNELYMMKIRPVYNDEDEGGFDNDACSVISGEKYQVYDRSISQPHIFRRSNLSLDLQSLENLDNLRQKEAAIHIRRRCSETDLDRIDRERTFAEAMKHSVLPEELLATVINALAHHDEGHQDNSSVELDMAHYHNDNDETNEDASSEHSKDATDKDHLAPPWELGLLHESDEEILLDDEANDTLQEVVVQSAPPAVGKSSANNSLLNTPQLIQRKVSEIIRKISAGSKESDGKKISRSEGERSSKKKISYDPDPGTPGTGDLLKKNMTQTAIVAVHKTSKDEKEDSRKISNETARDGKISKENDVPRRRRDSTVSPRISREHSPNIGGHHHRHNVWELDNNIRRSGRSSPLFYPLSQGPMNDLSRQKPPSSANSSCGNSRKISHENQFDYLKNELDGSGYELDHAAVSDLLRALDTVHDRLKRSNSRDRVKKISNTSSSFVPPNTSVSHLEGANHANQINVSNTASPAANAGSNAAPNSSRLKRRRKLGVFNPDFTYVNPSFQKECGDSGARKLDVERKVSKEESQL